VRRQPQIFEKVTLVARRKEHFWVFLEIFLVAQILPKGGDDDDCFYYYKK